VPCDHGFIEAAFNHNDAELPNTRSMHMAVLVRGGAALPPPWNGTVERGTVLLYDEAESPDGCLAADQTRWALFNPTAGGATPRWIDFTQPGNRLNHPQGTGNLACSGHTWTADGRLFIAGGNERHGHDTHEHYVVGPCILGNKLVYLFDPRLGRSAATPRRGSCRPASSTADGGTPPWCWSATGAPASFRLASSS
jgi:hypothetical protein